MQQNEMQMVRRIRQGERKAFAEFLDAYGTRVHRLVRRYVPNPSDAEDVTQEIFCDLYRSLGQFRGDSALGTWVYRIAVNHCLRHCQRSRTDNVPLDEAEIEAQDWRSDPQQAAVKGELNDQLQTALDGLGPHHADVVVLCELHGLTYRECAQVLEIPVGTVKSRLSNAIRRLRVSLTNYVIGESADAADVAMPQEAKR